MHYLNPTRRSSKYPGHAPLVRELLGPAGTRFTAMAWIVLAVVTCSWPSWVVRAAESRLERPNLLIITVDDMNADSIGAFGCKLRSTTPNIDRLAEQSLRFMRAHVQVGNCMPSRNVMWSGRYPHNNRVEGFYQVKDPDYPVLVDLMKAAGYFTAIRHKVGHSTPYQPYAWDLVLDQLPTGGKAHVKDAGSYGESTARAIGEAARAGKPFCLMVNVADPHKPFYAQGRNGDTVADAHVPSKVFDPKEVPIPGFLFDDSIVRKELAHYYSSVRRADDAVGRVLEALDKSGQADRTFVMFLSDHGMPLPFAKTQLYHHSTHTPLIIRWPGTTSSRADATHMVSAVDFLPTLLDVAGIKHPQGLDGRSFAPLIRGQKQTGREMVFKEYNENAGGSRDPMRGVQTDRYLYLFNPWSNGSRIMATATTGTPTYRRMAELAKSNPVLAKRHQMYQHRVVEELYDVQADPDCLVNLIDSPEHRVALAGLQGSLEKWMAETGDEILPVFQGRDDAELREEYIQKKERQAAERRKGKRKNNRTANKNNTRNKKSGKQARLITFMIPASIQAGQKVTVKVRHTLPKDLGKQQLHVTLKAGAMAKRLSRKVVAIEGEGVAEITFVVPPDVPDGLIRFAAFVGSDYANNLQHLTSRAQSVKKQ